MRRLGRLTWLIITVILITLAITFAASNEKLVTLYLWPFDGVFSAPIWLVVVSSFIIGGLLSLALLWAQWLAIRAKLWRLQGKFNKLEAKSNQQQAIAKTPKDKKPSVLRTDSFTPDNNKHAREAKNAVSEPPRTDRALG